MTTLSFTRKNNLLSLLRGYDLPIKRNYLNAALLGFGKHNKKDEDEKKEKIYRDFRSTVDVSLEKCFNAFRNQIDNVEFWHSSIFYKALCAFTRYYVAGYSETSSDFLENLEGFMSEIVQSKRYLNLLKTMDKLANEQKARGGEIPEEYETVKEKSKNNIRKLSFRLWAQETPDTQGIINLILDCIVYSTETPEEFALKWEKYKDIVTMSSDKDIMKIFSEDLQDTAADDDEESEGEYDPEDVDFVVSDDDIEYVKPVAKRRRLVRVEGSDEDSDDDEEVNGSGFYDWWW